MNRILVSIMFVVLATVSACAENWYTGYIVLKNKRTLRGEVAIQYQYDAILFRLGSDITVFPAFRVESFGIYDTSVSSQKEFVSIELSNGAATDHRFYEKVVSGEFSVLRRQEMTWYSLHLDVLEYDYFIMSDGGEILPMAKFRRKVYPHLLETTDGKLRQYIKENKLSPTRLVDTILIVRHYNDLHMADNSLAKN